MADLTQLDRETILRAVRTWPPDEQRALAGEILRNAGVPAVEEPLAPPTPPGSPVSWPRGRRRRPTTRWRAGSTSAAWSAMAASARSRPALPLRVLVDTNVVLDQLLQREPWLLGLAGG